MSEGPKNHNSYSEHASSQPTFEGLGASVEADPLREKSAYLFKFAHEGAITTIRIVLEDYSGADLVITNMTTLPPEQAGKGLGSAAIKKVLDWAQTKGMKDIRAVEVQKQSEGFWKKNGFVKMDAPNPTNDFAFKGL